MNYTIILHLKKSQKNRTFKLSVLNLLGIFSINTRLLNLLGISNINTRIADNADLLPSWHLVQLLWRPAATSVTSLSRKTAGHQLADCCGGQLQLLFLFCPVLMASGQWGPRGWPVKSLSHCYLMKRQIPDLICPNNSVRTKVFSGVKSERVLLQSPSSCYHTRWSRFSSNSSHELDLNYWNLGFGGKTKMISMKNKWPLLKFHLTDKINLMSEKKMIPN